VLGLGFAATRDLVSWLRSSGDGANPSGRGSFNLLTIKTGTPEASRVRLSWDLTLTAGDTAAGEALETQPLGCPNSRRCAQEKTGHRSGREGIYEETPARARE
jgi:hypothetical protein